MSQIKVTIIDDHKIVLQGLKSILTGIDDIEVIETYSSAEEFLNSDLKVNPDVLLLDMNMPGISGLELLDAIKEGQHAPFVIMLTALNSRENIQIAVRAGARGFLTKDVERNELIEAIRQVNSGEAYFGNSISNIVFDGFINKVENSEDKKQSLSEREIEVLKLVAEGLPHKLIADKLHISVKTVEAHKSNLQKKLDLYSTAELVKYAIREGYVSV